MATRGDSSRPLLGTAGGHRPKLDDYTRSVATPSLRLDNAFRRYTSPGRRPFSSCGLHYTRLIVSAAAVQRRSCATPIPVISGRSHRVARHQRGQFVRDPGQHVPTPPGTSDVFQHLAQADRRQRALVGVRTTAVVPSRSPGHPETSPRHANPAGQQNADHSGRLGV